ncbi:MAG: AbrB/MazE/SpoVT family DNA-binding domain-containing protein [Thermicanus sp.]|nr:AbrB/MazE/SpoVT family DNA-binding domain-containing protein [Thermicanus sp.]
MKEIIQQVQKRMLISLAQVAKELNIKEGDHVLIEEKDGGIFIRPVAWHDKSQEYFWTEEWQEKMKRCTEDLKVGRYEKFDNMDALLKELGEEANADDHSN